MHSYLLTHSLHSIAKNKENPRKLYESLQDLLCLAHANTTVWVLNSYACHISRHYRYAIMNIINKLNNNFEI